MKQLDLTERAKEKIGILPARGWLCSECKLVFCDQGADAGHSEWHESVWFSTAFGRIWFVPDDCGARFASDLPLSALVLSQAKG
jgi:hypothetical protein